MQESRKYINTSSAINSEISSRSDSKTGSKINSGITSEIGSETASEISLRPNKDWHKKVWKIVIQGGVFSFNEIALKQNWKRVHRVVAEYIQKNRQKADSDQAQAEDIQLEIIYGYTTAKVFEMINSGQADFGQFAIHNLTGLLVRESLLEIQKNNFLTLDYYTLKVQHYLMKKRMKKITQKPLDKENSVSVIEDDIIGSIGDGYGRIDPETPKKIMAHEQVLIQCQQTLSQRLPDYVQIPGSGNLTDNSSIAEYISKTGDGYCLASKYLADIFDLEKVILEGESEPINFADNKDNYTTFMLIA